MQRHLTLFTEHVQIPVGSRVLISELDDAELLAQLAQQHVLSIFHRDYAVGCRLRGALAKYGQITFHDSAMEDAEQKYDAALLQIPNSRGFAQALLYSSLRALKIGGMLLAIGPTNGGGNTAMTDAGLIAATQMIVLRSITAFTTDRPERFTAPDSWDQPWQARFYGHAGGRAKLSGDGTARNFFLEQAR